MVPMYSWPGVKFLLNGGPPPIVAGRPWLITSRSVAQMAVASIRTSTSATPGLGTNLSTRVSWPESPRTQAFIVVMFFLGYIIRFSHTERARRSRSARIAKAYIIWPLRPHGFAQGGSDEIRAIGPADRRVARVADPCVRAGCDIKRHR